MKGPSTRLTPTNAARQVSVRDWYTFMIRKSSIEPLFYGVEVTPKKAHLNYVKYYESNYRIEVISFLY
jgi:hypothetical protein